MDNINNKLHKKIPIGKIPKDWEVVKLGSKISLEYGKGLTESDRKSGKYPVFGSNGIIGYHNDFLINSPGIVVGRKGTIGAITWSNENFWPIDTTYFVKLRDKNINLKWLFFKLSTLKLSRLNMATGTPGLNRELAYSQILPLPPLPEQQKIAEILGTVDKAIEKVVEAIAKTDRLKKGLMQELMTKGIGYKEFKDTEIGRIPKEWEVVRLGDIINLCQYGLSVQIKKQGKYPIVKMDDISDGYVVDDNVKYAELDEQTFKNFRLDKGDILFNRTNSYELVGRTGIFLLDGDYVFASYLIRLKPKHEVIDSHFLTFYMIFENDRIRKLASRAVHQANINATNLQKFKLHLPPLPEQKEIVDILSPVEKRLEMLREKKERFNKVKKGLMNDLLTGNKRVKV